MPSKLICAALLAAAGSLHGAAVAKADEPAKSDFVARHIFGAEQDAAVASMDSRAFTDFMVKAMLEDGRSRAETIYPGCPKPKAGRVGKVYRLDPVHGSMEGDGSETKPFGRLEEFMKSPSRPTLAGGDRLVLMTGNHGEAVVPSLGNDDFVTIEAQDAGGAVLGGLRFEGAEKVVARGLAFRSAGETAGGRALVLISGSSSSIVLDGNVFSSPGRDEGWGDEEWIEKAPVGLFSSAPCTSVIGNTFEDLLSGARSSGPKAVLAGNRFQGLVNDSINFSVDDQWILGNVVLSGRNSFANPQHPDGMQGWSEKGARTGNIVIDGNLILNYQAPILDPARRSLGPPRKSTDTGAWMQGICIFDGRWHNVRVTGNVVATNSTLGIAMLGLVDSQVSGNVVAGSDPRAISTGIWVVDAKDKSTTERTTVTDNLSQELAIATRLKPHPNVVISKLTQSRVRDAKGVSLPGGPPVRWGRILHMPQDEVLRGVDGPLGIFDVRLRKGFIAPIE